MPDKPDALKPLMAPKSLGYPGPVEARSVDDPRLLSTPSPFELSSSGPEHLATPESPIHTEANMAAPAARSEKNYHQDYIARIRHENTLPPPPGSPKLMDIPVEGLEYYTSAAFASRLARQQPLNIEADAELGMPINLVGMPGIFDGDESSIQAPLVPPPVHPKDKALLRPLSELGKPKYQPGGHSFLRRTEYISEAGRARADHGIAKAPSKSTVKARKPVDASKDEPINVLRAAIKGFDIANPKDVYAGPDTKEKIRGAAVSPAEAEAWNKPKHPTKPELKLVGSYPIIPDLNAVTDSGAFMVTKFTANPTQSTNKRDTRMDVGLLHPMEMKPEVEAEYKAKQAAHEADPVHNPVPSGPEFSYEFFLPADENMADKIKKKLDVNDPDKDDASLYTKHNADEIGSFRYDHVRIYDTARQSGNPNEPYKEIVLAIYDPELEEKAGKANLGHDKNSSGHQEKAAYYYPIAQKVQLKPRRNKNLAQLGLARGNTDDEDEKLDAVDVSITEPDEVEAARRAEHLAALGVDGGDDA